MATSTDYNQVFKQSDRGESVLDDLSVRFYYTESYQKGDPYETAYNEGKRAVLAYILRRVMSPEQPTDIINNNDEE